MAIAFLFPGQGSQSIGMGQDLYEKSDTAHALFDRANDLFDFDLLSLMFGTAASIGDPDDVLMRTEVTQPALYLHSVVLSRVLGENGLRPDLVAGHSLGEYSALAAAEAISFEGGLRVVKRRSELMGQAGEQRPGSMAAIIGADDADIESVCASVSASNGGVVQAANYNAPGQVVISGDVKAVEEAGRRIESRVIPLPVSGAFHSPLMDYARDGLAEVLDTVDISTPRCPIYLNVTGKPTTDPDEIRQCLLDQMLAPVRWAQSLRHMKEDGATRFVEVGEGRVLQGLVRRTLGRDADIAGVSTLDDVDALMAAG